MSQELTMSEALRDPMIRQLLRADRISLGSFAQLLENAARRRNAQASSEFPSHGRIAELAQAIHH